MHKLLLILALYTGIWTDKFPKDVTGKWGAEDVQLGDAAKNIPQQQRDMALMAAMAVFATATLEFKPDHTVAITAEMPNIPKDGKWSYDNKTGIITITGTPNKQTKPEALQIIATEKGGHVYFQFAKAPVVLTMFKKK